MKKLLALFIILFLCVGCSSSMSEETTTEEKAEETTVEETTTVETPEVINNVYYGEIPNDRASMEINNSAEYPYTYNVMISWSNGALEHVEWTFTIGSVEDGTVVYKDGMRTLITFEESTAEGSVDGYLETDEIQYEGQTGKLTFNNADKKVTWHSDVSDDNANSEDVIFDLSEY